jgi:hypothetical protein
MASPGLCSRHSGRCCRGARRDGVPALPTPSAALDPHGDARVLASQATAQVRRAADPAPDWWRALLARVGRGRWGQSRGWVTAPSLGAPWEDTVSWERGEPWRQRTAHLNGEEVFGVDYQICHLCGLGWVEQPYTHEDYQRCGLASAALDALRGEHPGLAWHTVGGHMTPQFWDAVGSGVDGGYRQRDLCSHLPS